MKCSCCGEVRDTETMAALRCQPEVTVCRACVGWLREQTGVLDSTPILPVRDMEEAVGFYAAAGFDVRVHDGGGYGFVSHDDESVFDLGHENGLDVASNRAGCYLIVPSPDEWHARLTSLRYRVTPLRNEDYGMREFALTDPSGNHLRFGHSIADG